jgi:hypothetical protein
MTFLRYPHLERFGNEKVAAIEFGITHIFPKLDGTNASVWIDSNGLLKAGSRNRELSLENDNAGFRDSLSGSESGVKHWKYLISHPNHLLYGEWLVPHTIKTYREDAWRRFWIFDVYNKETGKFLSYDEYQPLLEQYSLDYIPCIKKYKNGSYENFLHEAQNNSSFLLPDGEKGEGIVIKNYDWTNKHNEVTWAKIVLNEFKDKFHVAMGANLQEVGSNAQIICDLVCSPHLIEKEYAKIVNNEGQWNNKFIPRLLHTVFYSVVTEELWDCLKKINNGSVNFQELKHLCIQKTKQTKPELF